LLFTSFTILYYVWKKKEEVRLKGDKKKASTFLDIIRKRHLRVQEKLENN